MSPLAAGAPGATPPAQALDQGRFAKLLDRLKPVAEGSGEGTSAPEDLKSVARDFEAYFIQRLFHVMRESLPKGTLFGDEYASGVYRDMFDAELSKRMASAGGVGLAEILVTQLAPAVGRGGNVDRTG